MPESTSHTRTDGKPPLFDYLCAVASYIGGSLVMSTERRVLGHPITPDDVQHLAEELQDRGFRQALVVSFSLFDQPLS